MADTNLKVQIKFQATGDKELARAFKTAATANEKLTKANKKLNKETENTKKGFFQITTQGRLVKNTFATIRSKLLLMSFAFTLVTGTVGKFIQKSAQFEKVKVRLNAMFGSVEAGTEAFNTFNKIAATTPFTLEDVVEAGASLKAFGADAESLIKPVSDLAAFMGTTAAEAASALGRAFAGGAGAADILRERGILQLVRDSQGIEDLTKVTLPEFRRALEKTITDPSVGVAGATDKLSKTMSGLFSNLADSFSRLSAAVGDVATGSMFRSGVESLTKLFSSMAKSLKEINKSDIEKIKELRETLGIEAPKENTDKESDAIQIRIENLKKQVKGGRDLGIVNKELKDSYLVLLDAILASQKAEKGKDLFQKERTRRAEINAQSIVKNLEKEKAVLDELNQSYIDFGMSLSPFSGDISNILFRDIIVADLQKEFDNSIKSSGLKVRVPLELEIPEALMPKDNADKLAEQLKLLDEFENLFQDQLVNGFAKSMNQIISLQEQNLNARINNEIKALKETDKFRNASMEQRQTMEDDVRAKFADDQKRIFKMQKAMSISQVIIDTATSINKLMAAARATMNPAIIGSARAMSAVMGAFSATQISAISKQEAPAFARGGSFTTQGEQFIKVGDNSGGRERVDITPLSSPDFGDAGGGSSINVNIMGNVIGTQEFVRDNLLPEIENTIKRNLA